MRRIQEANHAKPELNKIRHKSQTHNVKEFVQALIL